MIPGRRKGKTQAIEWRKTTCPVIRIEGLSKGLMFELEAYLFGGRLFCFVRTSSGLLPLEVKGDNFPAGGGKL